MYICNRIGEMAEWSNAAVLKTVEGHTSGGSNPSFSALLARKLNVYGLFYFRLPERLPKVLINYFLKTIPIYNKFFIRILVS